MKYKSMEERPWGRFFVIEDQKNFKIKKIEVEIGQRLSYQYHKKRSEVWVIITGTGIITINDKKQDFKKDDVIIIPKESKHRIENNGNDVVVFIEIQTGSYFGEDDIVRIKDDYNRLQ